MRCTKCGCQQFAYTEEVRQGISIWKKILVALIAIIATFAGLFIWWPSLIIILPLISITGLIVRIMDKKVSNKSKTKAICQFCGNVTYLQMRK